MDGNKREGKCGNGGWPPHVGVGGRKKMKRGNGGAQLGMGVGGG